MPPSTLDEWNAMVPPLRLVADDGVNVAACELLAPGERRQLDEKREPADVAARALDELAGRGGGSARRDQVVDDEHFVPAHDAVDVHFNCIRAVFERIGRGEDFEWKLALLADRDEPRMQLASDERAEDEAPRLDADDAIDARGAERVGEL